MTFFDAFDQTPIRFTSYIGALLTLCAAALLGVYTYILSVGLINRVNQPDSLPIIQLALLNASGTVQTANLTSYGFWSADVYSQKMTTNGTNPTNATLIPINVLEKSTKLEACVAQPGYFCYYPKIDEKRLNGSSTQTTWSNVVLSWKPCGNSTSCVPAANYTAWLNTVTASKTEASQFYYPDALDTTAQTVGGFKLNAGIYLVTVHDDFIQYNDPLSGWPMKKTVKTFKNGTAPVAAMPVWNKNATLSFRYDKDMTGKTFTYTRPNHSILTLLANVGGAAFIIWLVIKVVTYPLIKLFNFMWLDNVFLANAGSFKQRVKKHKRVSREFNVLTFLKMQILLRGMIKKNLTPQVHKRHDLTWSSSEDEITGYRRKRVPGAGKSKVAPPKKQSGVQMVGSGTKKQNSQDDLTSRLALALSAKVNNSQSPLGNSFKAADQKSQLSNSIGRSPGKQSPGEVSINYFNLKDQKKDPPGKKK